MTKLKTKKGKPIAKRTLSVILAAAMVLSSNSLVWANVETEPQAEVEAAVEAPAEEIAAVEVAAAEDIEFAGELKEHEWNDGYLRVDAPSYPAREDIQYVLQDADGRELDVAYSSGVASNGIQDLGWLLDENWVGQTVRVYFYTEDVEGHKTWDYTTNTITIKPVDVTGKFDVTFADPEPEYTGKEIKQAPSNTPAAGNEVLGDIGGFDFVYSGDLVNAGSTVTVTGTPVDTKLYTGQIYGTYEIAPKTITASNVGEIFKATVKEDVSYEYTGEKVEIDASDVKLEEVVDEDTTKDISSAIKSVSTEENFVAAGDHKVEGGDLVVNLDPEALTNYDLTAVSSVWGLGEFEIAPLSLKDVTVTIQPVGQWKALDTVNKYIAEAQKGGYVSYTNAAGEEVNIEGDIEISSDEKLTSEHVGTYTATVKPVDGNKNVTDSTSTKLVIALKDFFKAEFTDMDWSEEQQYTGSPVELTAKQLGDLTFEGTTLRPGTDYTVRYENNTNAGTAYLIVEGKGTQYEGAVKAFPFTIDEADLDEKLSSAAETVLFNEDVEEAEEYAEAMNLVVKAKNSLKPAGEFTVSEDDYTVEYTFEDADKGNVLGNNVVATITAKDDTNFEGTIVLKSEIGLPTPVVTLDKESYVYTGAPIEPEITVTVGGVTLEDDEFSYKITNGTNVGTATIEITGKGDFATVEAEKTFEITKANAEDVTVTFKESYKYDGTKKVVADGDVVVKLADVDVTKQFTVSVPSSKTANVNAGKEAGQITLTPSKNVGDKNFNGIKEATFEIKPAELKGSLVVYDENGKAYPANQDLPEFEYDGTAKTFDNVKFIPETVDGLDEKYVTEDDYEIAYANNIDASAGAVKASIFVVAKGNFAGTEEVEDVKADTTIKSVVAGTERNFVIEGGSFDEKNITVGKTAEYGQGVPVTPDVKVVKNGITLKEGVDYKLEIVDGGVEVGTKNTLNVVGINGFKGSGEGTYKYEIVAKDLKNCEVIATGDNVTVMNGDVVVPSSEYTVKDNGDGTVTVTAKESSKNYTGSAKAQIVESSNQVLDVVAKPYTKTKIHVTWRNIKGADSYVIYKDGVKIAEAEDGKEGYIDGGMHSYDGIYEYQVAAVFNGKEGEKSDIYESTTRPADPVVNNAFTHKNGIRVETKAKGAEGYRVWIRQGGSNPTEYVEKKSTYGNYTFKDLKNGQKYVIKVQAYKLVNGKKVPSRNVVYVTGKAETAKKSLI